VLWTVFGLQSRTVLAKEHSPSRTTRTPQSPRLATCTMPPEPAAARMTVAEPGADAAACASASTPRSPSSSAAQSRLVTDFSRLATSCLWIDSILVD